MLAGKQCFLCLFIVEQIGRSDINRIDVFISHQLIKIGINRITAIFRCQLSAFFLRAGIYRCQCYALGAFHIVENVVNDKTGSNRSKPYFFHPPNLL